MSAHRYVPLILLTTLACDDPAPVEADVVEVDPEVDPCLPNPCAPRGASCSDDLTARLSPATGTCADGQCSYDDATEACDTTRGACLLGVCQEVDTLCDWPFGARNSFIDEIHFGGLSPDNDPVTGEPLDQCCFDLDGDGETDNQYGAIMRTLGAFTGDYNDFIAGQIRDGRLALLLDVHGLDDLRDDDHFEVLGYTGVDHEIDDAEVFTGRGHFAAKPHSFLDGTRVPRVSFAASLVAGHFLSERATLSLRFSFGGDLAVDTPIHGARLEGDLALGVNGVGLTFSELRIGGYYLRDELLDSYNVIAHESCHCAEYPPEANGMPIDVANGRCNTPVAMACEETDPLCVGLTSDLCDTLVAIIAADADRDGDGVLEAISVGLTLHAISTTIVGFESCVPAP